MTERLALVTGASEGIGRAFALRLAREGWTVTAVARSTARLDSLVAEARAAGNATITPLVADLSTTAGIDAVAAALKAQRYALLVNNAAFGLYGLYYQHEWDALATMLRLNVDALARLAHVYLQSARRGDAMLNVSSTLAFLPMPTNALYAATKAFVTHLSEALWWEGLRRGVYVANLCPGVTATQFHKRAGGRAERMPPAFITQTPEQVVAAAMRALARRRRPTLISGWVNVGFALQSRVLGRWFTTVMMGLGAKV